MRSSLMVYPVRRISVGSARRKSGRTGTGKLLGKLDAASERLARARSRR